MNTSFCCRAKILTGWDGFEQVAVCSKCLKVMKGTGKVIIVEDNTVPKTKYNNKRSEYNGRSFDSYKEMQRYIQLEYMEMRGEINSLECQKKYNLLPAQKARPLDLRPVDYIADFVYKKNGEVIIEDVKGYKIGSAYQLFKLKKKLMKFIHGLDVIEV